MSIRKHNVDNLLSLKALLVELQPNEYARSMRVLSGASIGKHVRHILEFYICLLRSENRRVCYDRPHDALEGRSPADMLAVDLWKTRNEFHTNPEPVTTITINKFSNLELS